MSTLAELRDLLETDLDDAGNATWSTDEIDRGIQRALNEYSGSNPQESVDTVELSSDGREIDISSASVMRLDSVWFPYDASDPAHPPNWVRWSLWGDTLYIISGDEPASGEVVRLFYQALHTIDGLNGESSTTVPAGDEEILVLGAGAHCALQKGRSAIGEAGVSGETPEHWLRWAAPRMDAFNEALRRVRQRELLKLDKRVPLFREGWERDSVDDGI